MFRRCARTGWLRRWGAAPLGPDAGGRLHRRGDHATRSGPRIVDERGTLTFAEVHRRTNALAHELARRASREQDGVAIMCRNHRGFIEATVACSKLGAGVLYLNTAFAGPQITDVLEREDPVAVIYDEEFAELVSAGAAGRLRFIAWSEQRRRRARSHADPLEQLIARGDRLRSDPAARARARGDPHLGHDRHAQGRARARSRESLEPAAALFSKIPLRARETTMIAAPMFHSWGFAHFTLSLPLGSTLVLRSEVRPRGDAQGGRPAPRERARPRAGDAAADNGAGRGDDRAL